MIFEKPYEHSDGWVAESVAKVEYMLENMVLDKIIKSFKNEEKTKKKYHTRKYYVRFMPDLDRCQR